MAKTEEKEARNDHGEGRFAIVSMITTDSFLVGCQVMIHSLRSKQKPPEDKSDQRLPELVVLITPNVSDATRKALQKLCDHIIEVAPIPNPFASNTHVQGWIDSGFTKLRIWELTQYEKVVYIDADCLVLEDLQELFALDTDFAAAPDVFPPDRFNAGVLVIKPDKSLFNDLRQKAATGALPSYDEGDTGFLNAYFADWFSGPNSASRLPFGYNAQRTLHWMTYEKNPGYWKAIQPLKVGDSLLVQSEALGRDEEEGGSGDAMVARFPSNANATTADILATSALDDEMDEL